MNPPQIRSNKFRVFLDDERFPPEGQEFEIVRSSQEAINLMISKGCPEFISFDHDLGGEDSGMKVAKYIVEKDLDEPGWIPEHFTFYVHSQNPTGKRNIEGLLSQYLDLNSRTA